MRLYIPTEGRKGQGHGASYERVVAALIQGGVRYHVHGYLNELSMVDTVISHMSDSVSRCTAARIPWLCVSWLRVLCLFADMYLQIYINTCTYSAGTVDLELVSYDAIVENPSEVCTLIYNYTYPAFVK